MIRIKSEATGNWLWVEFMAFAGDTIITHDGQVVKQIDVHPDDLRELQLSLEAHLERESQARARKMQTAEEWEFWQAVEDEVSEDDSPTL